MKWLPSLAAFSLLLCPAANAQVRPQPGNGDSRIQTVMYDPNQVIQLIAPAGYQVTLEFASDERIENVAVGDSGAWQVTPNKRGDHLFLKPVSGITTNMTVVTDARTYVFELSPGPVESSPFIVRFQYPAPPPAAVRAAETAANTPGRYKLSGNKDIRPDAISDDGAKTYIAWRPEQDLPAVFMIDRDGRETLADGAMRDGIYVLDSVNNKLLFRVDRKLTTAVRVPQVKR